jgi:hypothetical protein
MDHLESSNVGADLLPFAARNSQTWAELLWISGGCLNLKKCYFYAFSPEMNYSKQAIFCKDLLLPHPISIQNPADNTFYNLDRVSSLEGRRTLGVILSPNGAGKEQLKVYLSRAKNS